MKLAGVVVLYNPDESVLENVKSYLNSVDKLYAVDNSSNDNSKMFNNEKIEYISNHGNKGIAYALNCGAKKAIEQGYSFLLTMDQDSKFHNNSVDDMKLFLTELKENNLIGKISACDYDKLALISPFHRIKTNSQVNTVGIDSPDVLMTSGNIINLTAYQKVGGFKDWLFIDAVDFDFCLNLRKNGYQLLRLNFVELQHNLGDTVTKKILSKNISSSNHSVIRRYYIVRNRHYLYDLYKNDFNEYCTAELKCTKKEAIKLILCEKNKIAKLRAMYQGYKDYKKGIKGAKPL